MRSTSISNHPYVLTALMLVAGLGCGLALAQSGTGAHQSGALQNLSGSNTWQGEAPARGLVAADKPARGASGSAHPGGVNILMQDGSVRSGPSGGCPPAPRAAASGSGMTHGVTVLAWARVDGVSSQHPPTDCGQPTGVVANPPSQPSAKGTPVPHGSVTFQTNGR